jgi:hypothetical protein
LREGREVEKNKLRKRRSKSLRRRNRREKRRRENEEDGNIKCYIPMGGSKWIYALND